MLQNDGLLLMDVLHVMYRITMLFGEWGCMNLGWSAEHKESRQICISVQSPNTSRKEAFSLIFFFFGGAWGVARVGGRGMTQPGVTMALGNLPFPSYAVCFWASLEVAFGGRFCREAYGLPVDEEHSLPCVLEFLLAFLL